MREVTSEPGTSIRRAEVIGAWKRWTLEIIGIPVLSGLGSPYYYSFNIFYGFFINYFLLLFRINYLFIRFMIEFVLISSFILSY